MKSYTPAARAFLVIIWLCGLAATVLSWLLPHVSTDIFTVDGTALAVMLAALAGAQKVTLISSPRYSDASKISLGFLVTFAALIIFGPRVGVMVGIISGISAALYPQRQPFHQLLFNVALIATCAFLTRTVWQVLGGDDKETLLWRQVEIGLLATSVYFAVNTGCVAIILSLIKKQNTLEFWRKTYFWTAPSYFFGASCVLLVHHFLLPSIALVGLAIPVLACMYQIYRVYTEKEEQQQHYIKELQTGKQSLAELYQSTVQSLASAIDAKDQNTHAHILRVQRYAVAIAKQMGVEGDDLDAVKTGSLLHDIGKLGVPDYVLLKPGPLTEEEFIKMKRHPVVGAAILEPVNFPWPVISIVRHHHERWDGTGYPDNLKGEDIALGARILAVADVYDSLTTERVYRPAWSTDKARDYVHQESGTHFDPKVVEAFMQIVDSVEESNQQSEALQSTVLQPEQRVSSHIWRTTSELWALYEVGQALHSGKDMEDRLVKLARKLNAIRPNSTCAFLLYNHHVALSLEGEGANSSVLQIRATSGAHTDALYSLHAKYRGDRLAEQVATSLRFYRGSVVEGYPSPPNTHEMMLPFRSVLIVPLVHLGEVLGTLNLYHLQENAFSTDDEHLMQMIADQVQSVLYQDILFHRTRSDALTDSLTGLYNLRYLMQQIEPLLYGPSGTQTPAPYALLYLDLDNFKPINDSFGHQRGDAVLRDIAHLFLREVRPDDLIVRCGGDEFVIVLPHTSETGAKRVANRIRKAVTHYGLGFAQTTPGGTCLGISIGIVCSPKEGLEINTLISAADSKMYAEKASNKIASLPSHAAVKSIASSSSLVASRKD